MCDTTIRLPVPHPHSRGGAVWNVTQCVSFVFLVYQQMFTPRHKHLNNEVHINITHFAGQRQAIFRVSRLRRRRSVRVVIRPARPWRATADCRCAAAGCVAPRPPAGTVRSSAPSKCPRALRCTLHPAAAVSFRERRRRRFAHCSSAR